MAFSEGDLDVIDVGEFDFEVVGAGAAVLEIAGAVRALVEMAEQLTATAADAPWAVLRAACVPAPVTGRPYAVRLSAPAAKVRQEHPARPERAAAAPGRADDDPLLSVARTAHERVFASMDADQDGWVTSAHRAGRRLQRKFTAPAGAAPAAPFHGGRPVLPCLTSATLGHRS
ncbi:MULTISPECIES: hypothetical protein [unclassified Streptomyces]|uniref:hypothetical protein n=1 Tax=unclassified Streptomyces TaxID=2593676 RepID=UPI0018FE69FD|nr:MULTISPECIES: hypothetical protein [unclassified Streptomyces]